MRIMIHHAHLLGHLEAAKGISIPIFKSFKYTTLQCTMQYKHQNYTMYNFKTKRFRTKASFILHCIFVWSCSPQISVSAPWIVGLQQCELVVQCNSLSCSIENSPYIGIGVNTTAFQWGMNRVVSLNTKELTFKIFGLVAWMKEEGMRTKNKRWQIRNQNSDWSWLWTSGCLHDNQIVFNTHDHMITAAA